MTTPFAEAINAAYKTELINRGKLHDALGYQSPAEYEAAPTGTSHPASQPTPPLATDQEQNPG